MLHVDDLVLLVWRFRVARVLACNIADQRQRHVVLDALVDEGSGRRRRRVQHSVHQRLREVDVVLDRGKCSFYSNT